MKIQKKQKNKKLLSLLIAAGVLLIGVLVYTTYAKVNSLWPFVGSHTETSQEEPEPSQKVDYSPPTEQEIKNSQDGKKNSQDTPSSDDSSSSSLKKAHVALSYADFSDNKLEIRAFTTSVIEGSGKCTATITSGSRSITRTSSAFIDATSTICEPIYVNKSELSAGTWKVTVNYLSKTYSGSSETVEVVY